jgi:SAM-dependent methyltransferase
VWECACGSGQATLDLAARFARVIATDGSREQITAAPPHSRVEYRVATAEDCGLEDNSVDLVAVAQAIHWFKLEKFYAEVKRTLRPGGVIAVWAYGINHVEGKEIDQLVQEYYSETVGPYWPPERHIVEAEYRTIPFPFAELPSRRFDIEVEWTLEQLLGYYSSWSATNRYIKANGTNPIEPLAVALKPLWGGVERKRRVRWPVALRAGRKE